MAGVLTVSPPYGGGDPVSADHSLDPPNLRAQFSRVVGYITHKEVGLLTNRWEVSDSRKKCRESVEIVMRNGARVRG